MCARYCVKVLERLFLGGGALRFIGGTERAEVEVGIFV